MEIVKFGGSSLATPANIRQCQKIITTNKQRQIIVVSAPGKYGHYQTKVTDDLINVTKGAPLLDNIITRFDNLAKELLPSTKYQTFTQILQQTKEQILSQIEDYSFVVSRGEFLSAKLLALYLNYHFVDAKDILVINYDATIDLDATLLQIKKHHLHRQIPFVIGGFYGQRQQRTALFTRGGSDYTGAILAALMNASLYKNYTDANGIQTADPRLIANTRTIPCLDFDALDILTHNGAGIIHENVASLLKTYRVPLRVDNTFRPHRIFTEVHSPRCRHCRPDFFCITKREDKIIIVTKRRQQPVKMQIIDSTPATIVAEMQEIHSELLKRF